MFREVRKKHRRLDKNESLVVLKEGMEGVISTIGEDGYPYGVAINYVYFNDAIYFHSSNKGHKLDNIRKNNKVSLFVSKDIRIIPEDFTTYYKSVVVFGKAMIVEGEEKIKALLAIGQKYSLEFMEKGMKSIDNSSQSCTVIKINIEHITGKYSDESN